MNPFRDEDDFRVLKQNINIKNVLAAYGMLEKLKQRNGSLYGPCPLHQGDNPNAFRVHLEKGLWHCFTACGGGDLIELVRRLEHCSYAQVATHLRRLARPLDSLSIPQIHTPGYPTSPLPFVPFSRRIPLNPRCSFLQDIKGVTVLTAARFEAGTSEFSSFLQHTAAIRLHDIHGNPLGYCGRRLLPQDVARWGKWRFPRAFPKAHVLFNAHRALRFRPQGLVVVEGPWATLRLAQAGIHGAVALLGSQLSPMQAQWLANAPWVMLLLDGDHTGRQAARRIAGQLRSFTRVLVHDIPAGCEPENLSDRDLASPILPLLSL